MTCTRSAGSPSWRTPGRGGLGAHAVQVGELGDGVPDPVVDRALGDLAAVQVHDRHTEQRLAGTAYSSSHRSPSTTQASGRIRSSTLGSSVAMRAPPSVEGGVAARAEAGGHATRRRPRRESRRRAGRRSGGWRGCPTASNVTARSGQAARAAQHRERAGTGRPASRRTPRRDVCRSSPRSLGRQVLGDDRSAGAHRTHDLAPDDVLGGRDARGGAQQGHVVGGDPVPGAQLAQGVPAAPHQRDVRRPRPAAGALLARRRAPRGRHARRST